MGIHYTEGTHNLVTRLTLLHNDEHLSGPLATNYAGRIHLPAGPKQMGLLLTSTICKPHCAWSSQEMGGGTGGMSKARRKPLTRVDYWVR